jgi:hypothetical protein
MQSKQKSNLDAISFDVDRSGVPFVVFNINLLIWSTKFQVDSHLSGHGFLFPYIYIYIYIHTHTNIDKWLGLGLGLGVNDEEESEQLLLAITLCPCTSSYKFSASTLNT